MEKSEANLSFSPYCCCSVTKSSLTLWPHEFSAKASLSFTFSLGLLKLMSIELVMPSNHLILCRSLLLLSSIFPSTRVFSNELDLHIRWQRYWNLSSSISPFNEYSRLNSFSIDLLAVQGTLKTLLQHHSLNSSVFSLLYGPTLTSIHDYWKNHSFHFYGPFLAKWCLCFLICCLAFLPRSKGLWILYVCVSPSLQSPSLSLPAHPLGKTIGLFPTSMTLLLFCK